MRDSIATATSRSLKICFISRALPVHRLGGLEHHLRDLALALGARGHSIHVVTTAGGAADDLGAESSGAITITELAGTAPGDYSIRFFRAVKGVVDALYLREKFDVIIPIEFAGLFLPSQIGEAPVVPLIHGTMTSETPLDLRYWKRLTWMEKVVTAWRFKSRVALGRSFKRMVNRAPGIVVDSEFTKRELLRNCTGVGMDSRLNSLNSLNSKICVVPLGIDLRRYEGCGVVGGRRCCIDNVVGGQECPPHRPIVEELEKVDNVVGGQECPSYGSAVGGQECPPHVFRICLLGRLQRMKGIEVAIRGAAQLRLRGVAFRMTIGGVGDYLDGAKALARRLDIEDEVAFAGRIPPEDLAAFFAEHDVFLFPDLTQPAFGLVAVEAMAYGLPVIAARSGAIPEVIDATTGWLYDPWGVSELAALLATVAHDRTSLNSKAKAGHERMAKYTALAMAERTEMALVGILENRAAAGK